ncbi:hypothetical protein F5Y17DRAFT_217698 [Xylariaceae sp. FL0594]|nr:hypothetical protein F5Y17DRAFT_217698 [Xylariaceae sp. FL0594]
MNQPENARGMDEPPQMGGSVREAREGADSDMSRGSPPPFPDPLSVGRRPQAPVGLQLKDGTIGLAISRPTQVAQWPLSGPIASPSPAASEPYTPPSGRSHPPQRPPRPSRVPSILDSSRVQDRTPSFQYVPQSARVSDLSIPDTSASQSSRTSAYSSVGSIPDFPLPVVAPLALSRRSVSLGPPPSARRGASSFYSTASLVSPIPEESPKIRSHTSYASSEAIPESFGSVSPSSQNELYFDDTIAEESVMSDDADDSRLVRSASIGKRGKPSLVDTKGTDKSGTIQQRPTTRPVQGSPFAGGTGYIDGSSSSSVPSNVKNMEFSGLTADTMLNAFQSASAIDPSTVPRADPQTRPFRLSGLRRPPRLDIDAVRKAEARGSLTSLPDLIRRATRLASLMERGKRPASRLDDLDFPEEIYGKDLEKNDYELEKHQSGLSDMLAAFPPPASRRSMRQSIPSWPLPRGASRGPVIINEQATEPSPNDNPNRGRRCCGLSLTAFLLICVLIASIIVVAVVVPVELLVVNKKATAPGPSCRTELPCANGGTSVISGGVCACICSNGFTGKNCTIPTAQGCTTTTIETAGANRINNVTIGQAIPRLVLEAQANFSIPLSATTIISKFGMAELSCNAENALVTFNGQSLRTQGSQGQNVDLGGDGAVAAAAGVSVDNDFTLTLDSPVDATITISPPEGTNHVFETTITLGPPPSISQSGYPTAAPPTATSITSSAITDRPTSTRTRSGSTSPTPQPTGGFSVTDEVVDFARIAVLFVLQEKSIEQASSAQNELQTFFSASGSSMRTDQARNITIGNHNSVDLVNFFVDVGAGRVGGRRG